MRNPRAALLRMLAVAAALLLALGSAPAAHAHPLGNFSLNHHDGLHLLPDRVTDTVVVDSAEIPTAQDREATDTDDDGRTTAAEVATRAESRCARLARGTRLEVDGHRLTWRIGRSTLTYRAGAGGLPVARLTCTLHADADLTRPAAVSFASAADPARTGWKEVTATGTGVRLADSSVPADSPSDTLRNYPEHADDRPLDTVTAAVRTQPDAGASAAGGGGQVSSQPGAEPAVSAGAVLFPGLEDHLATLTADRDFTLPLGLFAVFLALLLGAGHAALPGHAKLAVAACLARRDRGVRAAVAVGATVTATHTAGVLAVGLLLTASGGLVGEQLLGWLGVVSGALIAAIGTGLVVSAVRALRTGAAAPGWHHGHVHSHSHVHGHAHGHAHDGHPHGGHAHGNDAARRRPIGLPSLLGVGLAGGLVPSPSALVILLGAVALSRTSFGVLLVLGYGLGMAATLTAAGLLLAGGGSRVTAFATARLPALGRLVPYGTLLTALAVLAVGLGLAARSLLVP